VNVTCRAEAIDAVVAFYRDVIGLAPIAKAAGTDPRGAWFAVDELSQLHVSERDAPAHPDAHYALEVDDLDAVVRRLEGGGHEWQPAPAVFGGGRGFTRDPARNRIELLQAL
jgi:catechol 2,3-dioxygenase-like lactoylglutathione lyase family enzyme